LSTVESLLRLQHEGRAKTVGVPNFTGAYLQRLLDETGQLPALNQVELHPRFQQKALRALHAKHGIVTQAWKSLGQGQLIGDPVIGRIARKHAKRQRKSSWTYDLRYIVHEGLPVSAAR